MCNSNCARKPSHRNQTNQSRTLREILAWTKLDDCDCVLTAVTYIKRFFSGIESQRTRLRTKQIIWMLTHTNIFVDEIRASVDDRKSVTARICNDNPLAIRRWGERAGVHPRDNLGWNAIALQINNRNRSFACNESHRIDPRNSSAANLTSQTLCIWTSPSPITDIRLSCSDDDIKRRDTDIPCSQNATIFRVEFQEMI